MNDEFSIEKIEGLLSKIRYPWNMTVPSIEVGYTNGAILWDGDEANFGELAPTDDDYIRCDFIGDNYQNSNAEFAIAAPSLARQLIRVMKENEELKKRNEHQAKMIEQNRGPSSFSTDGTY